MPLQRARLIVMESYAADCPSCHELVDLGSSGDEGSKPTGIQLCPHCSKSFRAVRYGVMDAGTVEKLVTPQNSPRKFASWLLGGK